ncbi:putative 4-mercaptohistidine N1-methyltransferase [Colwellia sp. MSW7]|uniref:4-mercaptohistidine N1-methyltransferase n=1 Tax=Colwellia maritima TaxID=2912588 RepID=A0ABS9WZI6_9GAMM|nr:putative 4-mercaptohistidine N1-methyltransferase [Colwellia maritima]
MSTGNEAIKSSRYAFRRHFYQHAGFRYVISKTKEAPVTEINPYETSTEICQKIAQEYNPKTQYIAELVSLINTATIKNNTSKNKLLNLGCGVGRVAFELAPYFEYIDAIDFSAQTIQHAVKLQQQETVRYTTINEGDIVDFHHLSLHELNLSGRGNNILFSQGDASNLKQKFTGYNIVIMDQVLEKSYQPKQVLTNIIERLLPQGLLVIASSYCFDESITTKENWLGGIKVNGENVTGFDGLHNQLTEHFTLINQQPLTTINTLNSHQTISTLIDVTVWKKIDDIYFKVKFTRLKNKTMVDNFVFSS